MDQIRYTDWLDVPPALKKKTDLVKFCYKLAPNQEHVALYQGPYGCILLYDIRQCLPIKKRKAK